MKKVVRIGNAKYYVQSRDDEIFLAHTLACMGYSVEEIARILKVNEKKVFEYLEDCW